MKSNRLNKRGGNATSFWYTINWGAFAIWLMVTVLAAFVISEILGLDGSATRQLIIGSAAVYAVVSLTTLWVRSQPVGRRQALRLYLMLWGICLILLVVIDDLSRRLF